MAASSLGTADTWSLIIAGLHVHEEKLMNYELMNLGAKEVKKW
jgi:hypothetical protein